MADIYQQYRNFKSFDIEFTDKSRENKKIICSVKSLENDKIIVLSENQKNGGLKANVNADVILHVYTDDGIYTSNSTVIAVDENDDATIYALTYPSQSKHSQRREYFRAEIPVPFVMSIDNDKSNIIEGITKNICGKGICFLSNRPFVPYKSISLQLKFDEKTVVSAAELVYSRTIVENNKPKFIHAFTLTTIDKHDVDFIVQKCFMSQLNQSL